MLEQRSPNAQTLVMTATAAPLAPTRSGPVSGVLLPADATHDRAVSRFLGIPFAAPISGENRFRAPQREASWTEVRPAEAYGPICPQAPGALESMLGADKAVSSDDCLNLNIWTPATDDAKRPVLVWIHGGAYVTGSGSTPWYDGQRFAANHDVVVVTINYRLGALGYLDLTRLVPGSESVVSPNNGVLDQIAALQWVQDCIAAFGGDPGNVTVFGESAGAMSIGALFGAPTAQGLIHRAILQSGAADNVSAHARADRSAGAFLEALNLAPTLDSLTALSTLPIDEIIRASSVADSTSVEGGGLAWQPVIGHDSLPAHPLEAVTSGAHRGIDVLFGTTREEMRLFTVFDPNAANLDRGAIVNRLSRSFDAATAEALADAYLAEDAARPGSDTWVEIATDHVFRWPAHKLANAFASGTANRQRAYEFEWRTPAFGGVLGSCHALEIPFVFNNLHQRGVEMFTGTGDERQAMADVLHHAWASFARHGDPNLEAAPKAPEWPQWTPEERHTFTVGTEVRVVSDPRGDALRRWPS